MRIFVRALDTYHPYGTTTGLVLVSTFNMYTYLPVFVKLRVESLFEK